MEPNFQYNYFVITITAVAIVAGLIYICFINKKTDKYRKVAPFFIFVGLLLPIIAVIVNSYLENQWSNEYIISFLFFHNVPGDWVFALHHICMWGYIILPWGIVMLLIDRLKK